MSRIELFKKISNYSNITHSSELIDTSLFIGEYSSLKNGNGGGWCRLDGSFGKKFKVYTIKNNGKISYSWNKSIEEESEIILKKNKIEFTLCKSNTIKFIGIFGIKDIDDTTRKIREDIRNEILKHCCVVCGNSNVEVDHKNGLYNNKRVLKISTQTLDDFQPLCRHCNDQKRESYTKMKTTNKRFKATSIPQLSVFNIDFTSGNEDYNITNPDTMIGTYWYDPIDFMRKMLNNRKV